MMALGATSAAVANIEKYAWKILHRNDAMNSAGKCQLVHLRKSTTCLPAHHPWY